MAKKKVTNLSSLVQDEVKGTFGDIIVYNPTSKQRKVLMEDASNKFKEVSKSITETGRVPEFLSLIEDSDEKILEYLKMLTNISKDVFEDEASVQRILDRPSDDLKAAIKAIGEIYSDLTDDLIETFMSIFLQEVKRESIKNEFESMKRDVNANS